MWNFFESQVYSTPVLSTTVGFGMKSGVKVVLCCSCPVLCAYWWWGQSVGGILAKFIGWIFGHYQQFSGKFSTILCRLWCSPYSSWICSEILVCRHVLPWVFHLIINLYSVTS